MDRWLKTGSLKKACDKSAVLFTNDEQIELVNDNGCIENSDDWPVNRNTSLQTSNSMHRSNCVVLNAIMTRTI